MTNSNKSRWFTLIEMLAAITWFFLIMVVVISGYRKVIDIRNGVDARQNLVQESYFTIEKFNILLKDFTIDYEEYFNRAMVWCDSNTGDFSRNVWENWYCDLFTNYWNSNSISWSSNSHELYYCSSQPISGDIFTVYTWYSIWGIWNWCYNTWYQSFWQYKRQFRDMKQNTNSIPSVVNDNDDEDTGYWPEAILNSTWVKELYLISQDGTQRVFLRRALVESWDRNQDWVISWDTEKWYNLQILRLKWFDAWNNHDFDTTNSSGVYDWVIDTRACDYSLWFICNWSGVWDSYPSYKLPLDSNDWRVNMLPKNITISDRDIIIYPTKKPEYSWREWIQINPYFTISFKNKLYWEIRRRRLWRQIDNFNLDIQTTFNTKNFYTK